MEKIVVVGTGGHARVVVGVLKHLRRYEIVGCLDQKKHNHREKISGVPVIGTWADLRKIFKRQTKKAALAIGDNKQRRAMQRTAEKMGFVLPALIHPRTKIEPTARIGAGAVVCTGAIIAAEAVIGKGAIVNSGSIIDHETVVGAHAHVAPGCAIAGRVKVGDGAFVGIGSKVIDGVRIGSSAVVGAGAVVIKNVRSRATVAGVPAKEI
jgi:UDP-perosamine 4-acetyltransferase